MRDEPLGLNPTTTHPPTTHRKEHAMRDDPLGLTF